MLVAVCNVGFGGFVVIKHRLIRLADRRFVVSTGPGRRPARPTFG